MAFAKNKIILSEDDALPSVVSRSNSPDPFSVASQEEGHHQPEGAFFENGFDPFSVASKEEGHRLSEPLSKDAESFGRLLSKRLQELTSIAKIHTVMDGMVHVMDIAGTSAPSGKEKVNIRHLTPPPLGSQTRKAMRTVTANFQKFMDWQYSTTR